VRRERLLYVAIEDVDVDSDLTVVEVLELWVSPADLPVPVVLKFLNSFDDLVFQLRFVFYLLL
jgi:hypothetical protein